MRRISASTAAGPARRESRSMPPMRRREGPKLAAQVEVVHGLGFGFHGPKAIEAGGQHVAQQTAGVGVGCEDDGGNVGLPHHVQGFGITVQGELLIQRRANQGAVVGADGFGKADQIHLILGEHSPAPRGRPVRLAIHGLRRPPRLVVEEVHRRSTVSSRAGTEGEEQAAVQGKFQEMVAAGPTAAALGPVRTEAIVDRGDPGFAASWPVRAAHQAVRPGIAEAQIDFDTLAAVIVEQRFGAFRGHALACPLFQHIVAQPPPATGRGRRW